MYGLTQQQAQSQLAELQKGFNPTNPQHMSKLKGLMPIATGGKKTIKTEAEMQGSGLYYPSGLPGGFTVTESETERLKRDPNSAEFKKQERIARQKATDEQIKRQGGLWKKY
jgi:hypothetical protein